MRTSNTCKLFLSAAVIAAFGIDCGTAFTTNPAAGLVTSPQKHWSLPSSPAATSRSQSSQLNLSPLEAWQSYNDALEANPLMIKSITAGGIIGSADLTGQALEAYFKKKEDNTSEDAEIDVMRTVRFFLFGLVLQGPWNHFFYQLLDGILPPTEEPWTPTTGVKVVIDQFVQAPIFTILIFVFLGTLEGKQLGQIKEQLDDDYKDTMLANWKLFVPATVVNLAFVPPLFRVLYLNVVFFFWSIFLSLKINKGADGEDFTQ